MVNPRSVFLAGTLAVLSGCQTNPFAYFATSTSVNLSVANLAQIDKKYGHYAAWAMGTGGEATLIGRFLVGPDGNPTDLAGKFTPSWTAAVGLAAISEIWLTQELPGATGTAPSKQVFMKGALGAVKPGTAYLAAPITYEDFAAANGTFVLDNPAFLPKWPNLWNGLWFEKLARDSAGNITRRSPGLDLPPLPQGWAYSGWVILPGGIPLRTGKFRDPADNDDWAGYTGLNSVSLPVNFPGPPMPGEDFNVNLPAGVDTGSLDPKVATDSNKPDLAGSRVIVAIDNAALNNEDQYPGPIRVLEGTVPASTSQNLMEALQNVAAKGIPSGKAEIQ
ncbi:MAG: hypothetical protein FJZ01_01295 [Candidatus Sericytochromatia bacterium]|nr:hypothetical protein [Candidatus Tanganyikabacteria bacterium]